MQRRIVSPAAAVAATMSASDSNFRCRKGEWFRLQRPWRLRCPRPILFFVAAKGNGSACSSRRGSDLPHPILIFVAAKKNGSACSGRSSSDEVRIRFYSPLPRRRMVSPADRNFPTAASILRFELRLWNHCRFLPGNALQCAVILDFRLKLANHCKVFTV